MIRTIFLLSLFLLTASLQAKVAITHDANQTTYRISIDGLATQVQKIQGNTFTKLQLKGVDGYNGVLYKVGTPEIPVVRFFVKADRAEDIAVTASHSKAMPMPIKGYLYPAQPSMAKNSKAAPAFVFNKDSYKAAKKIPNKLFDISDAGSVRGVPQKLVTIYPVQYDPALGVISTVEDFKVTVKDSTHQEKGGIETFAFIVGEKFANSAALAKFKLFKKELGYQVRTIIIDRSNKTPAKIRKALQKVYNEDGVALRYALIIGDAEDVPGKPAAHLTTGTTDHYYRSIDTDNYDSDINGPDIGLGRITVADNEQLESVLNKIMTYQKGNFSSEEWLNKIAFIATNDRYQVAEGSHNYAIDNYTKKLGYMGIFPNNPQAGGDQLYAITHHVPDATVVSTVKKGRFIVNYSGHGATTYWAGPTFKQRDVRSLDDPDARPFVISNACITAQFTISESFGETWIRHPQGAILYWGSMDSSYWDEDDILERAMYDEIFKDNGLHFDTITQYSLKAVWKYYNGENRSAYYWETYHSFGDPSVRLRTTHTKNINIEGDLEIPFGIENVNLTLTDDSGNALNNVRVALYAKADDTEYLAHTTSDANGVVNLQLPDAPAGTKFILTLYGNNTKLVQKELLITSADSPYLTLNQIGVDGRRALYTNEQANISFKIKNVGLQPTEGGEITIESIEGPATVVVGSTHVTALSSGDSIDSNQLQIKVGDAHYGDKIKITMKWVLKEGVEALVKKTFTILRGKLAVTAVDFGDSAHPELNGINPGENGSVFITITNVGSEDINNGIITLKSANSCLAAVAGEAVIDHLAAGASLRVATPFTATVSANCHKKDIAQFKVTGLYDGHVSSLTLNSTGQFMIGKITAASVALTPARRIPDNDRNGITVEFNLNSEISSLEQLSIKLDVTHTYRGDLIAHLISPEGIRVEVLKGTGGSSDNIHATLVGGKDFDISALKGHAVNGQWKFVIADKANGDKGTLDALELMVQGY